jgi:RecJ-like exonuclease
MKTVIITHSDTDGICAGAIALCRFPKAKVFFSKPVALVRELDEVKADRLVICDIAVNKPDAARLAGKLAGKGEVLYFDHHPMPPGFRNQAKGVRFFHDEKASTSEIIYKAFKAEIPEERVWIAIYGAIADYSDETAFIKDNLRDWDKRALYFEVSTIVMGIKNEGFSDYAAKRRLVSELSMGTNPSAVTGLVDSAREAVEKEFDLYDEIKHKAVSFGNVGYVINFSRFGFRGPAALFAATATGKPLGVAVFERKRHFDVTMRSRDPALKLNILAEKAARAAGGSGGGHPNAAGARIPMAGLKTFLKKADSMIQVKPRFPAVSRSQ